MDLNTRIQTFVELGDYLKEDIYKDAEEDLLTASASNSWFNNDNIRRSLNAWHKLLNLDSLYTWISPYKINEVISPKRVLIIMAGNIPLVGFHDFLSVLISGHKVIVKMSVNDNVLLKVIIRKLISINPKFKDYISLINEIHNRKFDYLIATGSNNSAYYFEYYFKSTKKIIRKNRRSVAILDGSESSMDIKGLADDVFAYFGLGCRNVSKLFLPEGYDLNKLFESFYDYSYVLENRKYANNYDYNKAVFLMGSNKLVENGFLIMKEDKSLLSPVAMLYYECYNNIHTVEKFIKENDEQLQCVVSKNNIPFGNTQKPSLWDYADGVDTLEFLRES